MKTDYFNFLKQPYVLLSTVRDRILNGLYWTIFFVMLFWWFSPDSIYTLKYSYTHIVLAYCILAFSFLLVLNGFVFRLFPGFFSEADWTIGRQLRWDSIRILTIGVISALFIEFIDLWTVSFRQILVFESFIFILILLPLSIYVVLNGAKLNSYYHKKAEKLNARLNSVSRNQAYDVNYSAKQNPIRIQSHDGGEFAEFTINDLLFIKDIDGGVEINCLKENDQKKKHLSANFEPLAQELSSQAEIIRCHGNYLVNILKVNHITGSAKGYQLHLKGTSEIVPVTQKYYHALKKGVFLPVGTQN